MQIAARTTAPPVTVHTALTDATQVRVWLAEFAEVELPHRYEFWGRFTPEGDAPHQRLLHVDDRRLAFEWDLDGETTNTEITLESDGDGTLITVSQSHFDFNDAITGHSIRGVLQTFWTLALANLVDHVEGRSLTPKGDFTSRGELRAEWDIAASPEEVFASITDSEVVTHWFGFPIGIEPRLGGRFAMGGLESDPAAAGLGDADSVARYVEFEPGRSLALDWPSMGVNRWELEGSDGHTHITMVQSGFDGEPPFPGFIGILAGISQLRRLHEVTPFAPIWRQPQPA
jgi:uncharacterized protein YndB with AHSA1/START domain